MSDINRINAEYLFEAIGTIDDGLLIRSGKKNKINKTVKWGSAAACLMLIIGMAGMGIFRIAENKNVPIIENFEDKMVSNIEYEECVVNETVINPYVSDMSDTLASAESEIPAYDGATSLSSQKDMFTDVPIDEDNYQEAREYSDEIMDLQNRISEAMSSGELPYVIVSAILENPDRVHVRVTTQDEDLIDKLKEYDTTGNLLEIEYSVGTNVEDYKK
jgi:hypothetical protein